MDNNRKILKGWSKGNFGKGLMFFTAGFLIDLLDGIAALFTVGDSDRIPLWYWIIAVIAISLMALGILGFLFVIPAFQKWRHTKYEWVAWLFLSIAILLICVLIVFRNAQI